MNRRSFLQLLSASAATIAIPVPKFILAEPFVIIPEMPIVLGAIRALGYYDVRRDANLVRLDAFNGKDQFGIDFVIPASGNDIRKNYVDQRKFCENYLLDRLKEEGWMASDMIALPEPLGYIEPRWMRA